MRYFSRYELFWEVFFCVIVWKSQLLQWRNERCHKTFVNWYLFKLHFPYCSFTFRSIFASSIRFYRIETSKCSRVGKSHTLYLHLSMIYHMYINEESNSSELLRCKLLFNHTWRGGKKYFLIHPTDWVSASMEPLLPSKRFDRPLLEWGTVPWLILALLLEAGSWEQNLF